MQAVRCYEASGIVVSELSRNETSFDVTLVDGCGRFASGPNVRFPTLPNALSGIRRRAVGDNGVVGPRCKEDSHSAQFPLKGQIRCVAFS